jgi:hypothetical protein
MNKIYSIFLLPIAFMFLDSECQEIFDFKTFKKAGEKEYSIELRLRAGGSQVYTLELHDLNTGTLIKTNRVFFNANDKKVVFNGVNPSVYMISFSSETCIKKQAIPGKGIILE